MSCSGVNMIMAGAAHAELVDVTLLDVDVEASPLALSLLCSLFGFSVFGGTWKNFSTTQTLAQWNLSKTVL